MGNKIIAASFWSIFSEILAKIVGPIVFLLLTRILSPKDFGIVSIATTILGFVYVISDLGVGKVIIQEKGDNAYLNKIYNAGFWFNFIIGLILCILMIAFSNELATFFGEIQSKNVIKAMAIQVLFFSLSSVQIAFRKRKLDFKFLFYLRIVTVLSPALVSIPFAFAGYGYWAIVYGQVIGSFINTIILWISTKWKPSYCIDFSILFYVFSKSIWNTIDQLVIWIPILLDTYLITRYNSTFVLGMYTTSRTLFTTATTLSLGAIMPVLYSTLSQYTENNEFKKRVLIAQKVVFTFAAFMGVFVFIFRDIIEYIIFNEKWTGISNIFGIIFLIMGFEYFYSVIIEALRAKGCFKKIALNSLISVAITVPILLVSIPYGITSYVIIRCLTLYIWYPLTFLFSTNYIEISIFDCINNNSKTIGILTCLIAFNIIIEYYVDNNNILNILRLIGFLTSVCLLWYHETKIISQLKGIITRK